MIYLKTIFSAPNEIKYIKLNLKESYNYIDKLIICEFNMTHTGISRELIFNNFIDEFTDEEKRKIIYIGADISKEAVLAQDDINLAHKNEQLIRGYFAKEITLGNNDIIFSVDADEVIFGAYYKEIIDYLNKWPWRKIILLPMYQYFYRINYLWGNMIFKSAIACKASYYKDVYPAQWRDAGKPYKKVVGCHFSWCLTIDEMLQKLQSYAHSGDYGHLAKRDVLEAAVRDKTYPFEPERDFNIKVLDIYKDKQYYPRRIFDMIDEFKELIGE